MRYRTMVLQRFTVLAMINMVCAPALGQEGQEATTLRKVIENVKANEHIYADLDVSLTSSYEVVGEPDRLEPPHSAVVSSQAKIRYVRQGEFFRLDRSGTHVNTERKTSLGRVRGYDGVNTRVYDEAGVANIIDRPQDDHDLVRPHMFLLRYGGHATIPLSVYLSGTDAVKAYPGINWSADEELVNTYEGERSHNGRLCHRVALTRRELGGRELGRIEFDLAEDRNYIPVRMTLFDYMYSRDIPWVEGQMVALREIEDGIWFPLRAEVVGYNSIFIATEKRQQVQTRREYVVESISLHPEYDISYFRDIRFPEGKAVYEIKNEKIQDSHIEGSPGSGVTKGAVVNRWLVYLNLAVGLSVGAFAAYRALRARRERTQVIRERVTAR